MDHEIESKLLTHVESDDNVKVDTIINSQFTATANEDATMHELVHLMQRPTLIGTGKITSAQSSAVHAYNYTTLGIINSNYTAIPGFVTVLGFPSSIIAKNPVVASKIKQFAYFKGDMKIDLKINKAPQVSGCLLVVYFPRGGFDLDRTNFTIQGLTSMPYKILDYSTDTSLTMTVPYIDEVDYFNFQQATPSGENTPEDYGLIGIFNLSAPESGVSNASVSYSLFGSFENIELRLPTADTVGVVPFRAQSGRIQRIPADDMMSGVNESTKVCLNYNSTPIDNSKVKYDSNETKLSYVLGRENIIGNINYPKGVENQFLGKVRCFPKRPVCTYNSGSNVAAPSYYPIAMQYGTFDYVCNLFNRWTGTIEIGIRLIKTKFHYGRIAVVFDPFNRISESGSNSLDTLLSTNYSAIIDLNSENGEEGSSNYYRFPIPYMNNVPYAYNGRDYKATGRLGAKRVEAQSSPTGVDPVPTLGREVYNPYLRFYALTELGYLDVAADNVPILISIRAGNDFELSVPSVNVALSNPAKNPEAGQFYCQSGLIRMVPQEVSKSSVNEATCVGETVDDLMTLTRRFTAMNVRMNKQDPIVNVGYDADGAATFTSNGEALLGSAVGLIDNTYGGFKLSNVEAIQILYKFTYGGRRYKCTATEPGSTIMARLVHMPSSDDNFNSRQKLPNYGTAQAISGAMVVSTTVNNFLEVERNFYSNRKLVSHSSDEIITQFISFSPTKTHELELQDALVALGPVSVKSGTVQKIPCIDYTETGSVEDAISSRSFVGMSEFNSLCVDEGLYYLDGTVSVADVNNAALFEAMPEDAGFTFLMHPPCVTFL